MRDPKRINKFCDRLSACWQCVPDWRFGQLISNVLGAYVAETKRDIFFPEDDEMIEFFESYFKQEGASPYGGLADESGTQEERLEESDQET